jgi:hypothetical protein
MDDNWWCQYDIMGVVIMELHNNWKWVILTKLQWVAPHKQWVAILQFIQLVH